MYYRADTQNRDTWKKIVQSQHLILKTKDSQVFFANSKWHGQHLNTVMDYRKQLDMCKTSVIHVQALQFAVTKKFKISAA